ncbi:hypothetical protein [Vibrio spartinae]|uniref:Uncharacterized protein n=1 Tax=Vibrio spartinae TaxID=1918945 RepID=A0A1N6MA15_9VIBR|nr:hypothetical protein [Vibrio spartinae]SIO96207.1 hypothetical protein VSP9026_03989 [Vibrio spartinae]
MYRMNLKHGRDVSQQQSARRQARRTALEDNRGSASPVIQQKQERSGSAMQYSAPSMTAAQSGNNTSGIVQRTVEDMGTAVNWAKTKSNKKLVRDNLALIAVDIHNDNNLYQLNELNAFYDAELKGKTHSELSDTADWFHKFKRYVAGIRDDEGAHGAALHGGSGDKFIVDRVNTVGQPNRASYLMMDDYLKWDSILSLNAEEIWGKYKEAVGESLETLSGFLPYGIADAEAANGFVTYSASEWLDFNVTWDKKTFPVQLKTEMRGTAVTATAKVGEYHVKINASIEGLQDFNSRQVRKIGATDATTFDVTTHNKHPVAHTGGLSPEFTIDKFCNLENEGHPVGDKKLKWVTKF